VFRKVTQTVFEATTAVWWASQGSDRTYWHLTPVGQGNVRLRLLEECTRPELVVQGQVLEFDWARYSENKTAVVFATRDERVMGRCAIVVNGILAPFVTIADARVTSMRLARLVRAVALAMQGTEGGTGVQQKLAVWEAVRETVGLWPETPAAMEPNLRLLAVNAPEPIVFAEDRRSVSVAGGSIIVRLASDAEAQRAMELPGAI
jgi:hypothetical protein